MSDSGLSNQINPCQCCFSQILVTCLHNYLAYCHTLSCMQKAEICNHRILQQLFFISLWKCWPKGYHNAKDVCITHDFFPGHTLFCFLYNQKDSNAFDSVFVLFFLLLSINIHSIFFKCIDTFNWPEVEIKFWLIKNLWKKR